MPNKYLKAKIDYYTIRPSEKFFLKLLSMLGLSDRAVPLLEYSNPPTLEGAYWCKKPNAPACIQEVFEFFIKGEGNECIPVLAYSEYGVITYPSTEKLVVWSDILPAPLEDTGFNRALHKFFALFGLQHLLMPILSTNPPKTVGYYFCHYVGSTRPLSVEDVVLYEEGTAQEMPGVYKDDGELQPIFYDENVMWAGPIPLPANDITRGKL